MSPTHAFPLVPLGDSLRRSNSGCTPEATDDYWSTEHSVRDARSIENRQTFIDKIEVHRTKLRDELRAVSSKMATFSSSKLGATRWQDWRLHRGQRSAVNRVIVFRLDPKDDSAALPTAASAQSRSLPSRLEPCMQGQQFSAINARVRRDSKSPCRRWRCRRRSWRRSRATRKSSTAPAPSSTTTAPTSPSTPTGRWCAFEDAPFEIIDGDRGTNYPKKKTFRPQVTVSSSTQRMFVQTVSTFRTMEFISKEKDQALRKGKASAR